MKAFDAGDPQPSGKTHKVSGTLKQGISSENAKKITKLIRDEGPKNVKTQIQGEGPGDLQEPRRPAVRHRAAQGADLPRSPCSSSTIGSRRRSGPTNRSVA